MPVVCDEKMDATTIGFLLNGTSNVTGMSDVDPDATELAVMMPACDDAL